MNFSTLPFKFDPTLPVTYIGWNGYQEIIEQLVLKIQASYQPGVIIGIFQGGWMVAQSIADYLSHVRTVGAKSESNLDDFTSTFIFTDEGTGNIQQVLHNSKLLLVDEVIDSGKTMQFFLKEIEKFHPKDIKVACTHRRLTSSVIPDFAVTEFAQPQNYVFPWRTYRDLTGLIYNTLLKQSRTVTEIVEEMRSVYEIRVIQTKVEEALATLLEYGVVRKANQLWEILK